MRVASRKEPENSIVHTALGTFYKSYKMYTQSVESFVKAIELAPYNMYAIDSLLSLYLETQQFDYASKILNQLMKK